MEDILQSIRKIIADDETAPAEGAPAGEISSDILELTDMVQEDGSVMQLQADPAPAAAAPSDVLANIDSALAQPAPPAPVDPAPAPAKQPPAAAASAGDKLLSDNASAAAAATLHRFAQSLEKPVTGVTPSATFRNGLTVEELVIETLKPMLKDWLDQNLPVIVERIVQKEVKKLMS